MAPGAARVPPMRTLGALVQRSHQVVVSCRHIFVPEAGYSPSSSFRSFLLHHYSLSVLGSRAGPRAPGRRAAFVRQPGSGTETCRAPEPWLGAEPWTLGAPESRASERRIHAAWPSCAPRVSGAVFPDAGGDQRRDDRHSHTRTSDPCPSPPAVGRVRPASVWCPP